MRLSPSTTTDFAPSQASQLFFLSHDEIRYECHTFCGIPEVTLLGSVADWTNLHSRFIVLAETWMHRTPETCAWVKSVDEFLKQFIAARSGERPKYCDCSEFTRGVLLF
jgi:hypothetical protein